MVSLVQTLYLDSFDLTNILFLMRLGFDRTSVEFVGPNCNTLLMFLVSKSLSKLKTTLGFLKSRRDTLLLQLPTSQE